MTPSRLKFSAFALAASLTCFATALVQAQPVLPPAKGTPKVQPRPSATSTVPAGVDGGTPATSISIPLGTPTTPANDAERNDMRRASAAARAAARGRTTTTPAADQAASAALGASADVVTPAARAAAGSAGVQRAPLAAPQLSPVPSPTPSRPAR